MPESLKRSVRAKQTHKANNVCFGKMIVELKAVSAHEAAHHSQVYNYLHMMYYALIRAIRVICAT